jgi:hypothetical protein
MKQNPLRMEIKDSVGADLLKKPGIMYFMLFFKTLIHAAWAYIFFLKKDLTQ